MRTVRVARKNSSSGRHVGIPRSSVDAFCQLGLMVGDVTREMTSAIPSRDKWQEPATRLAMRRLWELGKNYSRSVKISENIF